MNELLERAKDLFLRLLRNREALTVALFSVGNAAAGLLANRVLTQLVPPRPLGELYLLLNLALWFTLPSAAAFLYVQRHWSVARARGVPRAFAKGVGLGLVLQAALAAGAVLTAKVLGRAPISTAGALALFLASCGQAVQQIVAQVQGLERRRITAGVLELLLQPARLAFLGVAALALLGSAPTGEGLLWLHAGWMAALAALLLWLGVRLLREVAPEPDQGTLGPELSWRGAAAFSLPFLATALVMQLCTSAERWGLARIDDPASTALFVQAVGLSLAAAGASTSFLGTYFFPLIQQGAAQGADPLAGAQVPLRRYLLLSAAACLLLALLGVSVSGPASTLLFGPRYAAVAGLLPWTVAGAALFTFAQALAIRMVVLRDTVSLNVARTASLLVYGAVLVLLRPREQPALAFARVYCAAQALYLALMWLATLRAASRPARPGVM